jgi:hypothetical protein
MFSFIATPATIEKSTMIMDSTVPHKVPAISTSEDSNDVQPSCSDYLSNEITPQAAVMDDESRDMGETHCGYQLEKPLALQDRDDAAPTIKEEVTLEDTATSQRNGEDESSLDYRETNETRELLTVKEEDDDIISTKARFLPEAPLPLEPLGTAEEEERHATSTVHEASRSLLPSPSASFDHAMDGLPWSHSFTHKDGSSAKDRPCKPRHRRSPATTVRLIALFPCAFHRM